MSKCCIKWCSARKNRNRPQLTLHKLPSNEAMKKKWLDIIGTENINPSIKRPFVCSLHFEETCFNRTLDVIRLCDGAVPSSSLMKGSTPAQVTVNRPDSPTRGLVPVQYTILKPLPSLAKTLNQDDIVKTLPLSSASFAKDTTVNQDTFIKSLPLPSSSLFQNQSATIDTLKKKCTEQRKIIKRLNEKVRRRDKKVAVLADIIQQLLKGKLVNNEEALLLKECAGPEDFLKRQI